MIAPLHLITNDVTLGSSGFLDGAKAAIASGGAGVVLHLRARETPARVVLQLAEEIFQSCGDSGARVSLNDRLDIALAVGTGWGHVGSKSLPPAAARRILGPQAVLGASVHSTAEVGDLQARVDYVLAGHVYDTASHPGAPGRGLGFVGAMRDCLRDRFRDFGSRWGPCGLIAIGGVSPERVPEVVQAGADGVAVLSGVWESGDPGEAVTRYLQALEATGRLNGLPSRSTSGHT